MSEIIVNKEIKIIYERIKEYILDFYPNCKRSWRELIPLNDSDEESKLIPFSYLKFLSKLSADTLEVRNMIL